MQIKEIAGFKMIVETPMEQYRYDTFWTKEPETIAWIEDMQAGEVLYDVGANIGIYTLYAASRGVQVVAIEPVLENFARLVQNVELNGHQNVHPFYMAIDDITFPEEIHFSNISIYSNDIGSSGSQVNIENGRINRDILITTLEVLTSCIGLWPDYLKIDVDGKEKDVLMSIYPKDILNSVLIEINPPYTKDKAQKWLGNAFTHDNKYNTMTPHSRERRQKEGIAAENVIFTRTA